MGRKARQAAGEPTSRWFRVIVDRWDWMPKPTVMVSFPRGAIGYRPKDCIAAGLAAGAIEVIDRPDGYSVDKAGNVVINGH